MIIFVDMVCCGLAAGDPACSNTSTEDIEAMIFIWMERTCIRGAKQNLVLFVFKADGLEAGDVKIFD